MTRLQPASRLTALILGCAAAMGSVGAQAQELMARVLTSTAVLQQVAVPRQVCTSQQVIQPGQPTGAGAAMGAIAGGVIGNSIGGGSGRDIATMIGVLGGAVLGNKVEGTRDEVRNVQQCSTQTTYENRVLHYDVVYEYEGKRYSIKMPNDPGQYVRLQLNPVGALPAAPGNPPTSNVPTTTIFTPISSHESRPHYSHPTASTVTIVQAPVYVPAPLAVTASPFVYFPAARPIYQPSVAPIGLSLNWSHSHQRHRGGHGHPGHWR